MSTGATAVTPVVPLHLKKGKPLGAWLCWAVVFADIGTSVYYTPGILFRQVGAHAALFVSLTVVVFILLSVKYAEVAARYPEGGGVVTVATRAIHPFAGALGGVLILVDYFLTASLSALSGVIYLSLILGGLKSVVIPATVGALVLLAVLNWAGVRASADTTAVFAVAAALIQLLTVAAVVVHVGPSHIGATFPKMFAGPRITPISLLTGYAGAFLAFSGLESIAQLSPAMAEPRWRVARRAMTIVVITMVLTSPLLTLWSTTLLNPSQVDPNQFISALGGYAAGQWLSWSVAISASLLLVFASNTALIGSYHIFLALSKMRFLPRAFERRNRWRQTPHVAIGVAAGVPLLVVILSRGDVGILGDLYAFGLLGAFSLTSLGLDIVRWHEGWRGIRFLIGVVTTILVALAWTTNLFAKPLATLFGGGLTIIGMLIALATYYFEHHRGLPGVFPHVPRQPHTIVMIRHARRMPPCDVLVVLPHDPQVVDALVLAAIDTAAGRPIVFLYRGAAPKRRGFPHLMEIFDPYLEDPIAQDIFGKTERDARDRAPDRRYVYIPWNAAPGTVRKVWEKLQPQQTLAADQEESELAGIASRPQGFS